VWHLSIPKIAPRQDSSIRTPEFSIENLSNEELLSLPIKNVVDEVPGEEEEELLTRKRCAVYTFYEPLKSSAPERHADSLQTLRLWMRSWYRAGWQPQVLSLNDCKLHPDYDTLHDHFKTFPTVNRHDYELICYLRWLGLQVRGGGLMVDFDIYPLQGFNLTTDQSLSTSSQNCGNEGTMIGHKHHWPMIAAGNSTTIAHLIEVMRDYQIEKEDTDGKGHPHLSDMVILRNKKVMKHLLERPLPDDSAIMHCSQHAHHYEADPYKLYKWTRSQWVRNLLRYHLLNTYRITILKPTGTKLSTLFDLPCPFPATIMQLFPYREIKKASYARMLPNYPSFKCAIDVKEHAELRESESLMEEMKIYIVHKEADCDFNYQSIKGNPNTLVFPIDADLQKIKMVLGYFFGFTVFDGDVPKLKMSKSGHCPFYKDIAEDFDRSYEKLFTMEQEQLKI